jgi:hypothetical protein
VVGHYNLLDKINKRGKEDPTAGIEVTVIDKM